MAQVPHDTATAYKLWFQEADKDNNGHLTAKELQRALKAKGYKTSRKQFKQQFRQFDLDGDKKITLQEYLICMGQVPDVHHKEAKLREAFKKADRNNDGSLAIGELNSVFQSMQMSHIAGPDALFKLLVDLDKDKSGRIDYNEFIEFFISQKGVFQ